jgi:hypothetical protein
MTHAHAEAQFRIRPATSDDLDALVAIHLAARDTYYRGVIPDQQLDDPAAHAQFRDAYAHSIAAPERTVLCAQAGGAVVGFASLGPPFEPVTDVDPATVGQLVGPQEYVSSNRITGTEAMPSVTYRAQPECQWKQQPVAPAAVGAALVAAQHAHRAEPHPPVGADRPLVEGRGIDGEAVMAAPGEPVAGQGPDRVGAQPAAMSGRVQEDVDGGVAVVGVGLLPVLDEADQLPVGLHREGDRPVVGVDKFPLDPVQVVAAPPAGDLGVGKDLGQPHRVVGGRRPEADGLAVQRSGLGRDNGRCPYEGAGRGCWMVAANRPGSVTQRRARRKASRGAARPGDQPSPVWLEPAGKRER